jgi:plasmid stabilization system protein ParE
LSVTYTAAALRDIEEVYNWYEDRQERLGDRFIIDLRETAAAIDANPKGFAKRIGEARRATVQTFPYALYFLVPDDNVIVACLHAKRSPALARERALGIVPIDPPKPS